MTWCLVWFDWRSNENTVDTIGCWSISFDHLHLNGPVVIRVIHPLVVIDFDFDKEPTKKKYRNETKRNETFSLLSDYKLCDFILFCFDIFEFDCPWRQILSCSRFEDGKSDWCLPFRNSVSFECKVNVTERRTSFMCIKRRMKSCIVTFIAVACHSCRLLLKSIWRRERKRNRFTLTFPHLKFDQKKLEAEEMWVRAYTLWNVASWHMQWYCLRWHFNVEFARRQWQSRKLFDFFCWA